jgi:sugar/nucleoside kinase (ribokinase family)
MDAESQLISMMSNDFFVETYKETLEDFGLELNLVQDMVTSLNHRIYTELHRKSSGLTHGDIHGIKK